MTPYSRNVLLNQNHLGLLTDSWDTPSSTESKSPEHRHLISVLTNKTYLVIFINTKVWIQPLKETFAITFIPFKKISQLRFCNCT